MISIKLSRGQDSAKVTFSLDDPRHISVVGDFNDWDPMRSPLIRRSNGLRSSSIDTRVGAELRFRYLADDGEFFDDPDANRVEPNGYGGTHSVVIAEISTVS